MKFEFEFRRTIDDFIDFDLFQMKHSHRTKKWLFVVRVFTGLIVMLPFIMASYLIYSTINAILLFAGIAAGICMFILFPQINRRETKRRIRQMLTESNNKVFLGPQVLSFSSEGIAIKSQAVESKINWSAISEVVQSDKHYFLYLVLKMLLSFPKNVFTQKEKSGIF